MSKISIHVSYKNACILKHALRNQIKDKKEWLRSNTDGGDEYYEERKELEEEIKAFEAVTEEIEWATRKWRLK